MSKMTRKELLSVSKRNWNENIYNAGCVYIIPSGRKHDSGYTCMDMVAAIRGEEGMIGFGECCDDIQLVGDGFRIDCEYPSRIIRIWNCRGNGTFSISHDSSSIQFVQDAGVRPKKYEIYKEILNNR